MLIVDDDRDMRKVLEVAMRAAGYEVRTAPSGEEGIAVAGEWLPSIILCDIGLPGMNGYEVATGLRELRLEPLKLIALTGFATAEDRDRALAAGFDMHVAKGTPRFLDDLMKAVERLEMARGAAG
jgi:CheY-like chemotaxis protein